MDFLRNLRAFRKASGQTLSVFWDQYGVTESGGGLYERGRAMPGSLAILMALVHTGSITRDQLRYARRFCREEGFQDAALKRFEAQILQIEAHRLDLLLNQSDFWWHFGTCQSSGSRYVKGRVVPNPTRMLLASYFCKIVSLETLAATINLFKVITSNGENTNSPVRFSGMFDNKAEGGKNDE